MKIVFHPDVLKQLQRLPRDAFETALLAIVSLAENPRPAGAKKLVGADDDWRIRFGRYRIIYQVDNAANTITVFVVAKRSDAYR